MTENGMVIVGAGEAGARAAVELREQGWMGRITLIGEEKHAPYERPPLYGTTISCDAVIIGIGAVPETTLAAECGLEIENGVRTDEQLRTSDPHIYAAGDCCSFPHKLYDGKRIRLEVWRNAQDQGAHAAINMLGAEEPYTTVPWFWSDQYEQTLQVAGLPDGGDRIVAREVGDNVKLFFHLSGDGRLVAASGVGPISKIAKDIRLAEMLIHQQSRPDIQDLANPDVKLKSLLHA